MSKAIRGGRTCAIARTVDVLKDPWSFVILREAFAGVTRFADFRSNLGIASDVLTERLNGLVAGGVLTREQYQEPGSRPRPSYHLTAAGAELKTVLGAVQQWGDAHLPLESDPSIERRHRNTGDPVEVAFVDARGRKVDDDDVTFVRTASYPSS